MSTGPLLETTAALSIQIRGAVGHGPTSLAAFDAALNGAGVSNFNLVRLSSVIPPGAVVSTSSPADLVGAKTERYSPGSEHVVDIRAPFRSDLPTSQWGHRLYAVWAHQSAELLGQEAWAGVSWVQHPDDGRGLFVEHEGGSESQVREELEATLRSISATRGLDDLERQSVVVGCRCEGEPVSALVIAPFAVEGWSTTFRG